MRKPRLTVVVLNWNGWRDTLECLESLRTSRYPNLSTIVVDNDSSDGSPEKIRRWATKMRRCKLVRTGRNLGYAGGNNTGIQAALEGGAEYVLLLNNDAVLERDCAARMVEAANGNDQAGAHMVAAKVLRYDPPHDVDSLGLALTEIGVAFKRRVEDESPLFCPEGSCALYSRRLLETVHRTYGWVFDPDYFMYYDDVDLGWRSRALGFKVVCEPRAVVRHKVGASTQKKPSLPVYYGCRNSLLFALKRFPAGSLARQLPWLLGMHLTDVLNKLGTERFMPALRGKWHALREMRAVRAGSPNRAAKKRMEKVGMGLTPNPYRMFRYAHWLPPDALSGS